MNSLYAIACSGLIVCTLWWFFAHEREHSKRLPGLGFFVSGLLYILALVFNTESVLFKILVLARDIAAFLLLALLANTLVAHRRAFRFYSLLLLVLLLAGFDLLRDTFSQEQSLAIHNAEIMLDLRAGVDAEQLALALKDYNLKIERAYPDRHEQRYAAFHDNYILDLRENTPAAVQAVLDHLHSSGLVDWAEINEICRLPDLREDRAPHDAVLDENLDDPDINRQWGFAAVGMHAAYDILRSARPAKKALVVLLGSGIDSEHEDLREHYIASDYKSDQDHLGHGTHCAGIVAAEADNGIGMVGMDPDGRYLSISAIKVLNDAGRSSEQKLVEGILRAADQGADVICITIGGKSAEGSTHAVAEAIAYAREISGAVVVAAAGDLAANASAYTPANAAGIITVSALDKDLDLADFCNSQEHIKMPLAAPGTAIYSTWPRNGNRSLSGSAQAASMVAGMVGLMKALRPDLTAEQVWHILSESARPGASAETSGPLIAPAAALRMVLAE